MKSRAPLRLVSLLGLVARLSGPRGFNELAILKLIAFVALSGTLGCNQGERSPATSAPDVPYVGSREVERLVQNSTEPVLFEFCVPAGCFRCDQMRASINALAKQETDRLSVFRVNLNVDRKLAAEWGVTVCPTYVVFAEGRELNRTAYPTSADLVSAMIPNQSRIE